MFWHVNLSQTQFAAPPNASKTHGLAICAKPDNPAIRAEDFLSIQGGSRMRSKRIARMFSLVALAFLLATAPQGSAQFSGAAAASSASSIPESRLIQPEALNRLLKPTIKDAPLIVQVGSRVFFRESHIPGAQYAGPTSQPAGIASLESLVSGLPKDKYIVLYCGCCPWNRCPNVAPAYKRLTELGFTKVKVLYLANNFGDDWVKKGYPAVPGK